MHIRLQKRNGFKQAGLKSEKQKIRRGWGRGFKEYSLGIAIRCLKRRYFA
jgi:hypothetical protein